MGQETDETRYGCPCGKGVVVERVTSYDNGYSRDDHVTIVQCDACKGKYRYKELTSLRGTVMTATETSTGKSLELEQLE